VAALSIAALAPGAARAQATSIEPAPVVAFDAPGPHQVTLEVCNSTQCSTIVQTVIVLDPNPAITLTQVTPAVEQGQLVRLRGAGSGKPPLSFSWEISSGATTVAMLPGETAYWDTTGAGPGAYVAKLRLSNGAGAVVSLPSPVLVAPRRPSSFYTLQPCRVLDTRAGGTPLAPGAALVVPVAGVCGIPAAARAVAFNVTVVNPAAGGSLVVYPGDYPLPTTTVLGLRTARTRAGAAVIPLSADGSGTVAVTLASAGSTHLILDVSGYFAPLP
jgi:hypothetical protein